MTNMTDNIPCIDEPNKHSKLCTFHDLSCKNGISPEGMTRIGPEPNPSVVTTNETAQ